MKTIPPLGNYFFFKKKELWIQLDGFPPTIAVPIASANARNDLWHFTLSLRMNKCDFYVPMTTNPLLLDAMLLRCAINFAVRDDCKAIDHHGRKY